MVSLSDLAHAAVMLGELGDSLRAARDASGYSEATAHLLDAQFHHRRFSALVALLGPESDDLQNCLYLFFSTADCPPRNGFVEALVTAGTARAAHVDSLIIGLRNTMQVLRNAKAAAARGTDTRSKYLIP